MRAAGWLNRAVKTWPDKSLLPAMGRRIVAAWVTVTVVIIATVYLFTFQEKLRIDLDRVAHIRETLSLSKAKRINL